MERLPHSQARTFGLCACVQGRLVHEHMEACFRRPILRNGLGLLHQRFGSPDLDERQVQLLCEPSGT
eukprot:3937829-Rhodomonas_salina.1